MDSVGLGAFRGNFLIAFAGAALIIFLIKITPHILPAKYYFSFSKIMASDSEPFIVDPPGITGKKLCAILDKYAIQKEKFQSHIDCGQDYEPESISSTVTRLSVEDKDRIYTLAFQRDPHFRQLLKTAISSKEFAPLSDSDVNAIAAGAGTVTRAFEDIFDSYQSKLNETVEEAISKELNAVFIDKSSQADGETVRENRGEASSQELAISVMPRLSDEQLAKIVIAHRSAATRLSAEALRNGVTPINKSAVDKAIKESQGWFDVADNMLDYYKKSLSENVGHKTFLSEFERQGLVINSEEEQRRLVLLEITKFSWANYVISILIRLAPVIIFGVLAGFLFGQREILAVGIAGALAAFLLSWPLMLLWERLVQSSWQDKKSIFLIFYAVYVLSFFVTARTGALLGAKLRQQLYPEEVTSSVVQIHWNGIMSSLMATVVLNVGLYIWNIIIPLQAFASS